jgi:hypothetical protein
MRETYNWHLLEDYYCPALRDRDQAGGDYHACQATRLSCHYKTKNKSCKKKYEAEDKEHNLSSRLYIHKCHAVKFT